MGVSMGVARNADRLNSMGFTDVTRFAQVTDPNNPTAGYIMDSITGKAHNFVTFMFAQKKTSTSPDFLNIICSSMNDTVSGKVKTNANGSRTFNVQLPGHYACSFAAMPVYDSTTWSGSYSPSADAKLSRVQLGFKYDVDSAGNLSNIRFGW
jgi:hypothetical protein